MPTIDDGRSALDSGNLQQARLIFEAILQDNPRDEEAWLGLADVLTDTNDKRICYENALKINRDNQAAREGLRNLEPEEDPFVAALKEQTATVPIDEGDEQPEVEDEEVFIGAEETLVTSTPARESTGETPTIVLVAAGLGLSVIVFAILAGVVFFLLTSIAGV
jgi:hypothetical protein